MSSVTSFAPEHRVQVEDEATAMRLVTNALLSLRLPSAVIACACAADAHVRQEPIPEARLMVERPAALQLERERHLLEAYLKAAPERKAAMQAPLLEGRDSNKSRRAPLPLRNVARATRAANTSESSPFWTDLVDSLDPQVVPGVFAARDDGLGEAMTVTLNSLWDVPERMDPEGGIEVLLYWIAEDGAEQVARREPAYVAVLRQGFDLYIRPPVSQAARWSLVLELRSSEGVVRGLPVLVECVEDLRGLTRRLDRARNGKPRALETILDSRLRDLREHGLRTASATRLSDWIAALDDPRRTSGLHPLDCGELDTAGTVVWEFGVQSSSPKRAVLILANAFESPTDLLSGPIGSQWAQFAEAGSRRLIAAAPAVPGVDGFSWRELVEHLVREQGIDDLVLVARGDFGRTLPTVLAAESCDALDALVICETWAARVRLPEALSLPTLQIEFRSEQAETLELADEGAPRHTHVRLREPLPLAALQSPDLLRSWLEAR